jgi:hypothetical protein
MKALTITCLFFLLMANSFSLFAQSKMMMSKADTLKPKPAKKKMDNNMEGMNMDGMNIEADTTKPELRMKGHNDHQMNMPMTSSYSLNIPMSRDGSGTSWQPDESHTYMLMKMKGKTSLMFHENIFLRYTNQDLFNKGSRGDDKVDAPNWFMGMLNSHVGEKGLFSATAMISLDPVTEGGRGYPILFQSGESWKGAKLVDRQHPHDLFSALAVGYSYAVNKDIDLNAYFGYPGEPALGPPVFMHRNSAMNIPDAPISHHWQDATHITFGTATFGLRYKKIKLEGSVFNGREPDEDRYNFDKLRFNSYSYRVSVNPTENWAIQFSQGFIKSPEPLEPGINVTRTTASVLYSEHFPSLGHFDGTLVWGLNSSHPGRNENSFLAEANLQAEKNAFYTRYEFVQKSSEEMDLDVLFGEKRFDLNVFTLGYSRTLTHGNTFLLAAGIQSSLNFPDKTLQAIYGKTPLGGEIYLRIYPAVH